MDSLSAAVELLESRLTTMSVSVIHGDADVPSDFAQVDVGVEEPDEYESAVSSFLDAIKNIEIKFAVIEDQVLEADDVTEAVAQLEELEGFSDTERAELRKRILANRTRVGDLAGCWVRCFVSDPPTVFTLALISDFYEDVYCLEEKHPPIAIRREFSRADIDAFAKKLANTPEFQRARNGDTRRLAAERFLGDDLDRWRPSLDALVRRASSIMVLDQIKVTERSAKR